MRPRDRQLRIIDLVRTQGKVSVDELTQRFSSSAETIRRDLSQLSADGKLKKIHGGAVALRDYGEGAFAQRMQQNAGAKRLIADKARGLVSAGDSLLIDTGSTTLVAAEALATIDGLTVVTNSTAIARVIGATSDSAGIFLLGGAYNEDNRQTFGAIALNQLEGFHGDLAVITVGAVSAEGGFMDYSFDEATIARAMIARCDRVVILADASKFDRVAPFVVASFDQVDFLVCDIPPDGILGERLEQARVKVV